jgi:hypothetical protein
MNADDGGTKGNDAMVYNRGIDAMVLDRIERAIPPDDGIRNEQDKTIRLLTIAKSDRRSGVQDRRDDDPAERQTRENERRIGGDVFRRGVAEVCAPERRSVRWRGNNQSAPEHRSARWHGKGKEHRNAHWDGKGNEHWPGEEGLSTPEHRSALWHGDVLGGSVQPRSADEKPGQVLWKGHGQGKYTNVLWHGHGQGEYINVPWQSVLWGSIVSILWTLIVWHRSVLWQYDKKLEHEREKELELARYWRDASNSDELGYELGSEQKDNLDLERDQMGLARCWRDAPNGSGCDQEVRFQSIALESKTQRILQTDINSKHLVKLTKPPWISIIGKPDGDPTFGPITATKSMLGYFGYFINNEGKKPKYCASLCPLGDETKNGSVIERRSVLGYVHFGHNTGQHYKLRLTLCCGGNLTSQGYYSISGRKPDNKQIGVPTSVSMYARTFCRI